MKTVVDKNTGIVLMFELDGVWCSPYELEYLDLDGDDIRCEEGVYYIELFGRVSEGSTGNV